MYAILSFLLICASFASAQLSADYQALLQQQSNSNQLSSSVATGSEQEAALRILAQQQKAQNPSGQGSFMNRALDSLNQLLVKDSLLAAPLPGEDTLFYRVYLDTVSVDSLEGDTTILEKIGFTEDGHHLLVKRKELIVKEPLYERYEIQFFRQVPASLFTNTPNAVNGDYPIKTGDRLVLTLFGDVEKEQSLEVNNQGKVNVSGIGLVPVNNLTLSQAESIIKSRLSKIYSGIPSNRTQVNLRIETLSAAKIFLVGEVSKPGGYVFYGNTSIFQALYFSGGPTKIGSVRNIRVTREDTSFVLDLYDYLMQGKKPEPSVLHDGDIVFLPRAEILAGVTGDVGRPAIYELRTGETIKDLLLFAGRINPTASHTLSLWRIQADGRRDVSDLQTPEAVPSSVSPVTMQDGDSLVVRLSTKTSRDYVDVEGAIWYPGSYAWKAGMTLAQAIPLAGGLRPEGYADRVIVRRLLPDSSYIYLADSYRSPKLQLKAQDQLIVLNSAQLKTPQLVYVDGAVKKPLTVDWQPGMTAKTLIAMADGFQLNHCKGTIRIERLIDGKDETKNLTFPIQDNLQVGTDDDVPLQPGDRVVVPQDPNFYSQEIVAVTGAVRNHGSFSLIRTRE
ncbi:MAG TPA: SLBB domain-containing protein, partial [Fibrobacteraceae bacterium]|nr:SLBB domain-containing protein [Fibrobacteraceae bacterium]